MAPNWGPLQSAWNSVTQPPAGVTGTGLTGAMTTAQEAHRDQRQLKGGWTRYEARHRFRAELVR